MRLLENLRTAERKGVNSVRRGVERAREEWDDVERRIRQKMRVYPQKFRSMMARSPRGPATPIEEELQAMPASTKSKEQPIVSINGRDVA